MLSLEKYYQPVTKFDEDEHPRGGHGQFTTNPDGSHTHKVKEKRPKKSAKAVLAKQNAVYTGAEEQRYAEAQEIDVAHAVKGYSLRDSDPVDVVVTKKGTVTDGIEVKTVFNNSNGKITMKKSAMDKKAAWMKENKAGFHTVVLDDTQARASGDKADRVIYYRRGFGSFRIHNMYVCKDLKELNTLMATPKKELPDAAKPTTNYRGKSDGNVYTDRLL